MSDSDRDWNLIDGWFGRVEGRFSIRFFAIVGLKERKDAWVRLEWFELVLMVRLNFSRVISQQPFGKVWFANCFQVFWYRQGLRSDLFGLWNSGTVSPPENQVSDLNGCSCLTCVLILSSWNISIIHFDINKRIPNWITSNSKKYQRVSDRVNYSWYFILKFRNSSYPLTRS